MNPKEEIENDKRLKAIFNGLISIWQDHNEKIVSLVLYHTDDYDLANEVLENFFDNPNEEYKIEEALFQCMAREAFENHCLESEYLDHKKCKELLDE
jgi:hypothetical protein